MNSPHTLTLDNKISRTAAIKLIKQTLENTSAVVTIDMLDVSFPLHRDFFLVLSRKFPRDKFILILKSEKTASIADSLGIQTQTATFGEEFDRNHPHFNLATHNMSMWEYFLYECRRGAHRIRYFFSRKKSNEPKLPTFRKNNFQIILIIAGLITSFVLLLFIFNFAISKSIIKISPEVSVRPVTANIIYRAEWMTGSVLENRDTIPLKKIELPVETSMKFKVTSIDQNSAQNAKWVVTIYNELNVSQELRPQTRFVTADGLVFRTTGWAKIPASRSLNGITEMGILEIEVEADIKDESGKLTGARGNIAAGTDLSIPGLKFNRDKVYAKAKDNFFGGADPSVHVLTADELENFKKTISEKLQKDGKEALEQKLISDKATTGEDFAMLVVDVIRFSPIEYEIISGQKIGDSTEEIELKAKNIISATTMDRKATINYLTTIFRENLLKWTNKEVAIHPDTLRVSNVISRNENDTEIKATLEMNTSTAYDFENINNELTQSLKKIIMWIPEEEAKKRLLEEKNINEVEIENYPFWMNTISTNIENIEFTIKN